MFEYLKPYQKIKNFNGLSLELPLCIYIVLLVLKFFTSKKLTLFYIILLLILPFSCYILIHKMIIEKYFRLDFIQYNQLLYIDFFKLFFTSFIPYMIFCYLTYIIKIKSKVGFISNILSLFYSSYVGRKLLIEFLLTINDFSKEKIKLYLKIYDNDKKIIYFIYLIIYYLISHILNL